MARRRVVDGEAGKDRGPTGERLAGDDHRDGHGRAETRRVEAPSPDERERCHTGEERRDHRSEGVAAEQRVIEPVIVAVDEDDAGQAR